MAVRLRSVAQPTSRALCWRCRSSLTADEGERRRATLSQPDTPLDFGDTKEAFRSKSFSELFRQYVVFKAFTFKFLVDNNKTVS